MTIFLDGRTWRRLRNEILQLGFCEIAGGEIVDNLARNEPHGLKQTVDAIVVTERFFSPDDVECRLWRQLRDAVLKVHQDSFLKC